MGGARQLFVLRAYAAGGSLKDLLHHGSALGASKPDPRNRYERKCHLRIGPRAPRPRRSGLAAGRLEGRGPSVDHSRWPGAGTPRASAATRWRTTPGR